MVLGLENGNVRFWDKTSWTSRRDVREHKKGVVDMKVDAKGLLMVSVGGREMVFWNLKNFTSMYHFRFEFCTF